MKGGVRKRGNSWYYTFDLGYVRGKRKRIERVAKGATTRAEAERILREKIQEYENAGHVFKPTEITVTDFYDYWMREYVEMKLEPNTQENYRGMIKNHILPYIGDYRLRTITPHVLQELVNNMIRKKYARKTVSILSTVLGKSFKHAVFPYKFINENPMQYVEIHMDTERKATKDKLKILNQEEVNFLFTTFKEGHPLYIPLAIGYFTGVRVGEACGIEWPHIDFKGGQIRIEQQMKKEYYEVNGKRKEIFVIGELKTKSSYRTVPMGRKLSDILRKELTKQKQNQLLYGPAYVKYSDHDYVLRKPNGQRYTPNVIKWLTRRFIREEHKIDFNYHSLRHTLATTLIENGMQPKAVQKILGHSRVSVTTDTYLHLTEKMEREAADIMDSLAGDF